MARPHWGTGIAVVLLTAGASGLALSGGEWVFGAVFVALTLLSIGYAVVDYAQRDRVK